MIQIHKCRVYHLKRNPTTVTYNGTKIKQKHVNARIILSPNLLHNTRIKVALFARPLLTPFAGANMVGSRVGRAFILKHYFLSKLSAAVREAFSSAYPDNEVPNKTTLHRTVILILPKLKVLL
jgi:hypothetical protein